MVYSARFSTHDLNDRNLVRARPTVQKLMQMSYHYKPLML